MANSRRPRRPSKRRSKSTRSKRQQNALPAWAWLVLGMAVGLTIAVGVYIATQGPQAPKTATITEQVKPPPAKAPAAKAPEQEKEEPKGMQFDFYKRLPQLEVIIPEAENGAGRPQIKPRAEALKPGRYALQAGSFRRFEDADRRKASLALIGVESQIQKVVIDSAETWHRVRIGPFNDPEALERTRARLEQNGIETLVIRLSG
ncbi:MAG: SPOR domain-containing protein [Pseudomonadota bacterium]|nr:SPOR domain-containing protein [Pseudomonadota bacterium]